MSERERIEPSKKAIEAEQYAYSLKEALLSLDRKQIEPYFWAAMHGQPSSDDVFWGAVHKARLYLDIHENDKEYSRQWLREHGMECGINEDGR